MLVEVVHHRALSLIVDIHRRALRCQHPLCYNLNAISDDTVSNDTVVTDVIIVHNVHNVHSVLLVHNDAIAGSYLSLRVLTPKSHRRGGNQKYSHNMSYLCYHGACSVVTPFRKMCKFWILALSI